MKTKTYDFKEALDLYIETGYKPIPTVEGKVLWFHARDKTMLCERQGINYHQTEIEVPIPEGRNPDELTIAHLQMGEDGEQCRVTEEGEPLPDDAEFWVRVDKRWQPTETRWAEMTIRTRKPKGWFNSDNKESLTTDKPDLAQEFEEMAYDPNNINKDLIMKLHERIKKLEAGK